MPFFYPNTLTKGVASVAWDIGQRAIYLSTAWNESEKIVGKGYHLEREKTENERRRKIIAREIKSKRQWKKKKIAWEKNEKAKKN